MSDAAKWYVVHTYSGYENKVASSIKQAVENRRLHDLIADVTIPVEKVTEVKDGKSREIERKLFPGYVLDVINTPPFFTPSSSHKVTTDSQNGVGWKEPQSPPSYQPCHGQGCPQQLRLPRSHLTRYGAPPGMGHAQLSVSHPGTDTSPFWPCSTASSFPLLPYDSKA